MWWITLPSASQTLCREGPSTGGGGGERQKEKENRGDRKIQGGPSQGVQHKQMGFQKETTGKNPTEGNHHENHPRNEGHEIENARGVFCRTEGLLTKVEP